MRRYFLSDNSDEFLYVSQSQYFISQNLSHFFLLVYFFFSFCFEKLF